MLLFFFFLYGVVVVMVGFCIVVIVGSSSGQWADRVMRDIKGMAMVMEFGYISKIGVW